MKTLTLLATLLLTGTVAAQTTQPETQPATQPDTPTTTPGLLAEPAMQFVGRLEQAHGIDAWKAAPGALQAQIHVDFPGKLELKGRLLYDHRTGQSRLDLEDGTKLIYDGAKAWIDPADAEFGMPRFHLLTWPYFLAVPFKLRDPGTTITAGALKPLDGKLCQTARLTFDAGVGDSPDDWYVLYAGPQQHQLVGMAYIVTYGSSAADAQPHAIVYDGYRNVDGVTLSTQWTFYNWDEQLGTHGKPIGTARLSGLTFVQTDDDTFVAPEGAREDPAP